MRPVLLRVEGASVDQLDPVAVRVGDERDPRELVAIAGTVGGFSGWTPMSRA